MLIPLLHFRHRTESLREARLICVQKTHDAPPENPFEHTEQPGKLASDALTDLTQKNATPEHVTLAVHVLGADPNVFELALEQSKTLNDQQRAIITQNLEQLKAQTKETPQDKQEVIERIRREFTATPAAESQLPQKESKAVITPKKVESPEATAAPEAAPLPERTFLGGKSTDVPAVPAPKKEEQGLLARGWEQAAEYWDKASPTTKALGAGAAVAIVAYGAYKLFGWLWGGTKKAAEKTKEGMGWFGKTLIATGGLALAGLAGYAGYRALENKMKEFFGGMKGAVEENLAAAKRLAEEQLARVETALQDGGNLAREQLEELKKQKKELTEKIDDYKKKMKETSAEESEPSEGEQPSDTKKNEAKVVHNPEVQAAATELVKESAEVAEETLLARYLVRFERHPDVVWPEGMSEEDQKGKLAAVINQLMRKESLKMNDIFQCLKFGKVDKSKILAVYTPPVLQADPTFGAYIAAAETVVRACSKHRANIERLHGEGAEGMSLKEFLDGVHGSTRIVDEVRDIIDTQGLDPSKWDYKAIRELLQKNPLLSKDLFLLIEKSSHVQQLGKEDIARVREKLKSFSLTDALTLLASLGLNPDLQLPAVKQSIENRKAAATPDEAIALALIESVIENIPTPEQLQPFFQEYFPTDDWVAPAEGQRISPENKRTIKKYIDTMPFHEVLRFSLYKRMIEQGNPAGVALMQFDVLRFIRKREEGLAGGMLKTKSWRAGMNVAESMLKEEYLQTLADVFYGIDGPMMLRIKNMVWNIAPTAVDTATKGAIMTALAPLEPTIAFAQKHPVLAAPFALYLLKQPFNIGIAMRDWMVARQAPTQLAKTLTGRGTVNSANSVKAFLRMRMPSTAYSGAGHLLGEIANKANTLGNATLKKALNDKLIACLKNGALDQHWIDYRKFVQIQKVGRTGSELTTIQVIEDNVDQLIQSSNAPAREAIRLTAHPFRNRLASHGIPIVLQALGAIAALGVDIPAWWHAADMEKAAAAQGKPELAALHGIEKNKRLYVDIPIDVGGGIAYYYAQKKLTQMTFSRTLTGTATAGVGGAFLVPLAVEAVRMEADHILTSLRENIADIEQRQKELRGLPKVELERKLKEYEPGRRGNWGQFHRYYSASRWIRGDSWTELERESDAVREKHMQGYLFHHLLQKAQVGDPFATNLALRTFNEDGTEKQKGKEVMDRYMADCMEYLQEKFGTRNNLAAIERGSKGLESTLHDVDLYANLAADIRDCRMLLWKVREAQTSSPQLMQDISILEQRIGASDKSEDVSALVRERDQKVAQFETLEKQLKECMPLLQVYDDMKLKDAGGQAVTLLDLASQVDETNGPDAFKILTVKELAPFVDSYYGAKSDLMASPENTRQGYDVFMKTAKGIFAQIEHAGEGLRERGESASFTVQPSHYDKLLQYAALLDTYPAFDPESRIRQMIWRLPGTNWQPVAIGVSPHEEAFKAARAAIKQNIAAAEQFQNELRPSDPEKMPVNPVPLIIGERTPTEVDKSRIAILFNGQETMFTAQPCDASGVPVVSEHAVPGLGIFICTARLEPQGGKSVPTYAWNFKGDAPGKFYMTSLDERGFKRPGEWFTTQERPTVERTWNPFDGEFVYPASIKQVELVFRPQYRNQSPRREAFAPADEKLKEYLDISNDDRGRRHIMIQGKYLEGVGSVQDMILTSELKNERLVVHIDTTVLPYGSEAEPPAENSPKPEQGFADKPSPLPEQKTATDSTESAPSALAS